METVLRLIEDDRGRRLEHLGRDFFAPVRRKAMHEEGVGARLRHQRVVHLIPREGRATDVGFRLLARNLAIGQQIAGAGARPATIREPAAFRAAHLDGLGTFTCTRRTVTLVPVRPSAGPLRLRLPWTRRVVYLAA